METIKLTPQEARIEKLDKLIRKFKREKEDDILKYAKQFGELEEEEFFSGIDLINKICEQEKERGIKFYRESGIKEFARLLACEDAYDETLTLPFEKFIKFYNTYESLKSAISNEIYEYITGYSDDGCSDYIDAFLLNGIEAYQEAIRGNMRYFKEGDWEKYYIGECYVEGTMRDAMVSHIPGMLYSKQRMCYTPPAEKTDSQRVSDWGKNKY